MQPSRTPILRVPSIGHNRNTSDSIVGIAIRLVVRKRVPKLSGNFGPVRRSATRET